MQLKTERISVNWRLFPLVAYWGLLFWGTHKPTGGQGTMQVNDKLVHFLGYFVLALLFAFAFGKKDSALWRWLLIPVAVLGIYAAIDEATQAFVPGRVPDFADWTADLAGAIAGLLCYRLLRLARFNQR